MFIKIISSAGFMAMSSMVMAIATPAQAASLLSEQQVQHQSPRPNLIASDCDCARYRACKVRSRALTAVPITPTPVAEIPPPPAPELMPVSITPAPEATPEPTPQIAPAQEFPAPRARG